MSDFHRQQMQEAISIAQSVRCITSPNPWVGCVIVSLTGEVFTGATYEDGINHAEIVALAKAGTKATGADVYVTLEPCNHRGKTGPCVKALIDAGVKKVFVGIIDPDKKVSGAGIAELENNGIEVELGLKSGTISKQLAPYIKHRKLSKPYIVLKMAVTIDGNIADGRGNSKWITGYFARGDSHQLRAQSDVIMVGANTVRLDNPSLTVRDWKPEINPNNVDINPRRVVVGKASPISKIQPCLELSGDIKDIIEQLTDDNTLQILVEGGGTLARAFHEANLIDKYVIYLAPAILGGVGTNIFGGPTDKVFNDLWRGEIESISQIGSDIRIDIVNGHNDY